MKRLLRLSLIACAFILVTIGSHGDSKSRKLRLPLRPDTMSFIGPYRRVMDWSFETGANAATERTTRGSRFARWFPGERTAISPERINKALGLGCPRSGPNSSCPAWLLVFVGKLGLGSRCQIPQPIIADAIGGIFPYLFTVAGPGNTPMPFSLTRPNQIEFLATQPGDYVVTVADAQGCRNFCDVNVTPSCTLTQSTWSENLPEFNKETRKKALKRLLLVQNNGVGVGIGYPGRSLEIPYDSAVPCLFQRLPALGAPAPLPALLGDAILDRSGCQTSPPLPVSGNTFDNQLLGQVIALSLNVLNDEDLSFTPICPAMTTQKALPGPDGYVGEKKSCDDSLDPSPGSIQTIAIPDSVISALSSLDLDISVGGLLELANRALAGVPDLGGATLDDINQGVVSINDAFDGCRFLLQCRSAAHHSNLQIHVDPDFVVPVAPGSCREVAPSWHFNVHLTEVGGAGVTITGFTIDNGVGVQTFSAQDFASLFNICGPGDSHIPAFGGVCGSLCAGLPGLNSGRLILTFYGTDDQGDPVTLVSKPIELVADPATHFQILFDPAPVHADTTNQCKGKRPRWSFNAALKNAGEVGVTITGFQLDLFHADGTFDRSEGFSAEDFAGLFEPRPHNRGSTYLGSALFGAPALSANFCVSLQGENGGFLVFTVFGIDDLGNQTSGSSGKLALLAASD
jgi:hypothetical protein